MAWHGLAWHGIKALRGQKLEFRLRPLFVLAFYGNYCFIYSTAFKNIKTVFLERTYNLTLHPFCMCESTRSVDLESCYVCSRRPVKFFNYLLKGEIELLCRIRLSKPDLYSSDAKMRFLLSLENMFHSLARGHFGIQLCSICNLQKRRVSFRLILLGNFERLQNLWNKPAARPKWPSTDRFYNKNSKIRNCLSIPMELCNWTIFKRVQIWPFTRLVLECTCGVYMGARAPKGHPGKTHVWGVALGDGECF